MEKFKRIVVIVCAVCVCFMLIFNFNVQKASAIDLNDYPSRIPNNFVVLEITWDDGDNSTDSYIQLPLPGDNVVDTGYSYNLRDKSGSIVGTYRIDYSEGLFDYTFNWATPVSMVNIYFNSLVYIPMGSEFTFFRFKADYPVSGEFMADTFHINRTFENGTLSQSVSSEPLAADYNQIDAGTYARANLTNSTYDVFVEYYEFRVDAPGESYSVFTVSVPARLWDPLEVDVSLSSSLDFTQDMTGEVVQLPTSTDFVKNTVSDFLDIEIIPGFSFGNIFAGILVFILVRIFLKLFSGG